MKEKKQHKPIRVQVTSLFHTTWGIIGIIILVFMVLLIISFAGCIYGCVKTAEELDKTLGEEDIKAVAEIATKDRSDVYNWVQTGMTKQQVRDKFGEPTKIQQMETDVSGVMEGFGDLGIGAGSTKTEFEYWYYGNVQIGFMNGKVSSKMKI